MLLLPLPAPGHPLIVGGIPQFDLLDAVRREEPRAAPQQALQHAVVSRTSHWKITIWRFIPFCTIPYILQGAFSKCIAWCCAVHVLYFILFSSILLWSILDQLEQLTNQPGQFLLFPPSFRFGGKKKERKWQKWTKKAARLAIYCQ